MISTQPLSVQVNTALKSLMPNASTGERNKVFKKALQSEHSERELGSRFTLLELPRGVTMEPGLEELLRAGFDVASIVESVKRAVLVAQQTHDSKRFYEELAHLTANVQLRCLQQQMPTVSRFHFKVSRALNDEIGGGVVSESTPRGARASTLKDDATVSLFSHVSFMLDL